MLPPFWSIRDDGVGQNRSQQQDAIFGNFLAFKVSKVPRKPRPIVYFEQQLGDLNVREQGVGQPHQLIGFFGDCTYQRRYFKPGLSDNRVRQFTRLRDTIDGFKLLFESTQPVLKIGFAVGFNG
jgi:hypothetical protein